MGTGHMSSPRAATTEGADLSRLGFTPDRIDSRLPKSGQVYELLRRAIITMKLSPGEPIVEKEICERLGVSRTPLREAIIQLAAESLVVVKPSGGTFVNLIMVNEVLDGQILRDTLEKRLVQLAARRFSPEFAGQFDVLLFQQKIASEKSDMDEFFELDNQFHKLICECSGFPNGWRTLHNATGQLDRIRRYALPKFQHFFDSLEEHRMIYGHLKTHDETAAVEAFQNHVDRLFHEIDLISQLDPELVSRKAHVTIDDIR
jgi:GntR family transcriptional regulator, rspAB operon transcriptional repressor